MSLTIKQESFCHLYIQTGNASEAYRGAYSASKMKPEVIHNRACELLKHGDVSVRISELRNTLAGRFAVTDEKVIDEFAKIAFADIRRLFDEHGQLKKITDLDKDIAAAIASIDVIVKSNGDGETVHVFRVKLSNKLDALNALAKHLGLFQQDNKQSGEGYRSVAEAIRAMDRARQ